MYLCNTIIIWLSTQLFCFLVSPPETIYSRDGVQETVSRYMVATKSDKQSGSPYAIACVTFGSEEKLKAAIGRGEARIVTRNGREFVQWETFDDCVTKGISWEFKATASKAISKDMFKHMTDKLKSDHL